MCVLQIKRKEKFLNTTGWGGGNKKNLKRGWDVGVYKKVSFHDRSYVISTLTRLQTSSRLHFSDLIYAEEDQSQPFLKIKEEAKIKKNI